MPRYIDADKLSIYFNALAEHAEMEGLQNMAHIHRRCLQRIGEEPTADVVPKSEVVKALNEVELLIIITKETYKQQMEDAPNELSKQSKRTKWIAFEKFYEQFAELKKKYTEDEK